MDSHSRRIPSCLAVLAVAVLGVCGCHRQVPPPVVDATKDIPAAAMSSSPYLNTRPEVQHVGDAVCAGCHTSKAKSYARHSMGRALTPVSELLGHEPPGERTLQAFEHKGWRCRVERRGERLIHHVQLGDIPQTAREAEVRFVLGSGRQGRSFLINQDGFLFQSPISWFSSKEKWGPSPGYETDQLLFTRPITEQCLFCHSNGPTPVAGTVNHYPQPIFRDYGIGCERCHGPGQLHAAARRRGEPAGDVDLTIVNPRRLTPMLRDSVCEQCHLLGEARIARRGHSLHEFRPGLPLHQFISVFVRPAETLERQKSVSELHQFYMSACYVKSAGKMGCIECHDPHREPPPEQRVAWYRGRCLQCHQDRPCSQPEARRRRQVADDSCIQCHMPRKASGNVPHAAVSDHRIPRVPGRVQPPVHEKQANGPPLRHFHEALLTPAEREDAQRDLGLAMLEVSRTVQPVEARIGIAQTALPVLEEAAARWPDDLEAQAGLGYALGLLKRHGAALTILDKVLAREPRREDSLLAAGNFAAAMGRAEAAAGYYQRLIEVNPWLPSYHYSLAKGLGQLKRWPAAADACRAAIRLEPTHAAARRLLVAALVQQGEQTKAREEFRVLLAMTPSGKDELQRWFDKLGK